MNLNSVNVEKYAHISVSVHFCFCINSFNNNLSNCYIHNVIIEKNEKIRKERKRKEKKRKMCIPL